MYAGWQLIFHLIEEVLANRKLVIGYGHSPSDINTRLLKGFTLGALDVSL
jgi:hypothetical protein